MVAGKAQILSISTEIFYNDEQSHDDMVLEFDRLKKLLAVGIRSTL